MAWAQYQRAKEKIETNAPKAREAFEKQARTAERFSVPFVPEESLTTNDTAKLLASQNEATRIVRRLDRLSANVKSPFTPDRTEILKAEYKRGLETGGVAGAAICRGVLSAADELGIDVDSVVDDFRNERHRKNLERAQHAARLRDLISKEVPQPPFPRPGARRGGDMHSGRNNLLVPSAAREQMSKPQASHSSAGQTKRRRAAWK